MVKGLYTAVNDGVEVTVGDAQPRRSDTFLKIADIFLYS